MKIQGYDRGGDKEFHQLLAHSKGFCGEVRSDLYVALDEGYISSTRFEELYANADEVGRLVFGFMTYLRQSQFRGRKFRQS